MDSYTDFIPDARGFFAVLSANNTKDWFATHKPDYERRVKGPATALSDVVEAGLARELGVATSPKIYRIHRDLRFSKDKTPYNTHLHMQWSLGDAPICFLFGVSGGYCKVGVGSMAFDKAALSRWREAVATDDPVADEIASLARAGWDMDPPELKRVPAPYDQDHPAGDLLRRKGIVMWHDLDDEEQVHLPRSLISRFMEADAFRQALAESIG